MQCLLMDFHKGSACADDLPDASATAVVQSLARGSNRDGTVWPSGRLRVTVRSTLFGTNVFEDFN